MRAISAGNDASRLAERSPSSLRSPPAINTTIHYYAVIDTDGGGAGPIPVYPGVTPGLGWVTGSATHFVEFYRGPVHALTGSCTPVSSSMCRSALRSGSDTGSDAQLHARPERSRRHRRLDRRELHHHRRPARQHRNDRCALIPGGASTLNVNITKDDTINNARLGFPSSRMICWTRMVFHVPVTDLTRPLDMIELEHHEASDI